jgi:hypothetical protein
LLRRRIDPAALASDGMIRIGELRDEGRSTRSVILHGLE